jgi:predicted flap endonuclease-1-like 5' DNA nuclease
LITSILATLALLAATSHKVVTDLSQEELLNEINQRAELLEDGQTLLKSNQEDIKGTTFLIKQNIDQTQKQIKHNFTEQEKNLKELHEESTKNLEYESANITSKIRKNLKEDFTKQEKNLKQIHNSLTAKIENDSADIKLQIGTQLQTIEITQQQNEKTAKKTIKDLTKQKKEIQDIKDKITQIEQQFILPKALLTSQSNPEKVRGIGPNTNNELKEMGITNIAELILADPKIISQKTSASEKMAKKLQGIAQLSMVPSLEEKDIATLEEIGITDQKELANQTPIEIGRKINKMLQEQINQGKTPEIEKPTIEKIRTWIKYAKT